MRYDILLIYGFSRLHPYYLPIVKYSIESKKKIGIAVLNIDKYFLSSSIHRIKKLLNTEKLFLSFASNLGAELIYIDELNIPNIHTDLLIVPQAPFSKEGIALISKLVRYRKVIITQSFGYGSNSLDYFYKAGWKKLLVYDKNIFINVIRKEEREDIFDKFGIVETGSFYKRYPLWNGENLPEIDYLIALPTMLFLKNPVYKLNLIKNIYEFISKLGPREKVVIKLHNVKDGGNKYIREIGLRSKILARFSEKFLGRKGINLSTAIFYKNILTKSIFLRDITPYSNFPLELFLPYVKKGVITGISTVIWHCLYNKIPVYNCDSQPFGPHLPNYDVYKNFYIPYCKNKLEFDEKYFSKISQAAREADLIEAIKRELANAG